MSSDGPSKTSGQIDSAIGTGKNVLGGMMGNDEMQAKGNAQHKKGETEVKTAEAKGWVEGAVDSVTGTVKNTIGSMTGNTTQQAEGKVQEQKGEAQKAANS